VDEAARNYLMPSLERARRHVVVHGPQAALGGVTASGVLAGFLSASDVVWPLLSYLGVAAVCSLGILVALVPQVRNARALSVLTRHRGTVPGRPRQLPLVTANAAVPSPRAERLVAATRCDDPVYGAGLRVLLGPSAPLVVIPSNRRDVGREAELPFPLFAPRHSRTRVEIDLRPFGIPLAPYAFERELPEGVQDVDHTLAVKDLVFVPELAAALGPAPAPVMWPEHCVDPLQLAHRDVVVVGGPDTNFWHGALFEPIARQFETPASSVPLALGLRYAPAGVPSYHSRAISVTLAGLHTVLQHSPSDRTELDERLYPTYGLVLACRNPFAAAIGRSHWCVFVAGTRSLGTSGAVLGLTLMLRAMRADPELNVSSLVPTDSGRVDAPVSAVLCRTVEVEQSVLRRGGTLTPRGSHRLPAEGLDPNYSDSYVPLAVEHLSYAAGTPRWTSLGRLGPGTHG
jgi:hypothetical protein